MSSQKNNDPTSKNTFSLPEALYDFVATYTTPALETKYIFYADQNNISIPSGTEEYAVITIINAVSHGTPIEEYQDSSISITTLYEYFVQIGFFSNGDNARKRAIALANIGRSSIAPSFFYQRGVSVITASDPYDVTFVEDTSQNIKQWLFTLQVTRPEVNILPIETANIININKTKSSTSYFENLDIHNKP